MRIASFAAFLLAGLVNTALAAPADIAKARNCMSCHTLETRMLGPGFKEIAAKYRSTPGAREQLVTKVLKGGVGAWGAVPMPPNNQLSQEEATALVNWILSR